MEHLSVIRKFTTNVSKSQINFKNIFHPTFFSTLFLYKKQLPICLKVPQYANKI